MTATAARMQAAQPPTAFRKPARVWTQSAHLESARQTTKACGGKEPLALEAVLPPVGAIETDSAVRIWFPLNGVDARHIYVLATAHCISIEIRVKNTVSHSGIIHNECQRQCVTRELQFQSPIQEGSTSVRMGANRLEITCKKSLEMTEKNWSEWIQLDTRASLGCVGRF